MPATANARRRELRLIQTATGAPTPTGWAEHSEYGLCRTITGHAWRRPTGLRLVKGNVTITLTCYNCPTTRTDIVAYQSGLVDARRYDYPKGYCLRLGRGVARPARAELRAAWLHLMLGGRQR